MSGNHARLQAIASITKNNATGAKKAIVNAEDLFGLNVFHLGEMKKRLPKSVYKSVAKTIEEGSKLDASTADSVAAAMKDWAISKGATHYTHVFYPLTGSTAEKHDSFLLPTGDGRALTEFSGSQLIQSEPDGSSFPTGGIRVTFEARGYTAWDVTSPAYLMDSPSGATLCIPTAFVSWTGEALDQKTPLLRSIQAVSKQARRVLALFGDDDGQLVSSSAGAEQEYFLIDSQFYNARPDLIVTGRTLFGAPSPKGQEFDDHYFGLIKERVLAYMFDVERELLKLGVPVKTRHNEVAPGQYEIAPIYESANVAADHQQVLMSVLEQTAPRHGLVCLCHEKPFAGVNGSGKHVNFSLGNGNVGNLLEPGDNPHKNLRFLTFCSAVIRGVSKYQRLLRAVVASAGNDHRLGANEAPPAIISIFLGEQLEKIFEQLKAGSKASSEGQETMNLGVDTLPRLPLDSGDRNRTSPFAFTGNKFEFRAVGSDQSIAGPMTALNTIVAESLDYIANKFEGAGSVETKDILKLLQEIYIEHGKIVFGGDGYSDAWHKEAVEERGLANLKTSADALPVFGESEVVALFEKYDVLSSRESESRMNVYLEQYNLSIQVEAKIMVEMAQTMILPATIRYQQELASGFVSIKALGKKPDTRVLDQILDLGSCLQDGIEALSKELAHHVEDPADEARHVCDVMLVKMVELRATADALEALVSDDLWPLPTYQEMLFIK